MAVTIFADGSTTLVAATPTLLTAAAETTPGVYQLWLNTSTLTSAQDLFIECLEKARNSSGTQLLYWDDFLKGVQGTSNLWHSPTSMLINGWAYRLTSNGTPTITWHITKA